MTMLVDENENENESENVDLSARSEVLFDFIERCARCALMSHDPRAWGNICAMIRKGEQRSVKTSGELGGTVDLWYGTHSAMLGVGREKSVKPRRQKRSN